MIKEMQEMIVDLQSLDMDAKGRHGAIEQVKQAGIKVNNKPVAFSYVPMIVTKEDMQLFDAIIVNIQKILEKMTLHYISDQSYRALFGFDKRIEELICLPCNNPRVIPFGRYDLFYDFESGDYAFCEINTDGSGGMSWNDHVTEAILQNYSNQKYLLDNKIELINATDAFAKGIKEVYQASENAITDPLISIVDFKEEGVLTDFEGIIDALGKMGIRARFTDVRDLIFDGEVLRDKTDNEVIHGIYRRLVSSVLVDRYEECRDLINAVAAKKVVLMGHFRTTLAHSKKVFSAMYHPITQAFLDEDEIQYIKKHIPETYILSENMLTGEKLNEVRNNRNDWVLKPEEGFGSYGVLCGMDADEKTWQEKLMQAMQGGYVLQKFCKRYTIPVVRSDGEIVEQMPLMLGIFQTNGHASALYSRAAHAGVIDYSHGGVCVGAARVK